MKKIILLLLVIVTGSLQAQVKYTVKGKVPANSPAKLATLWLMVLKNGKAVLDTAYITNGAFEFKGVVARPHLAQVTIIIPRSPVSETKNQPSGDRGASDKISPLFYIDGNTNIIFDTSGIARVTGGKEQKIWNEFLTNAEEERKNKANVKIPYEESVASRIKEYPDSYNSLDALSFFASLIDPKVFEPMFNSLSKRMQNTDEGKKWKADLALAKRFTVGQPSIDFALNDTSGRPISLASYKGKYVLLDFWASWCKPCRATHPDLIKAYRNYRDKNFEILAVSLDKQKEPWLNAIATDKITWMQVSDLKGATGKVPMMYGIKAIPQNYLIDPNGIIVGKNLKGEALDKKLSELLK